MTTGIAILNASGVALAADSTLTVSNGNGKLHYPGIDKIFGLSPYDAVAIMIYGSSEFMGVPWEVVIKTFRDKFTARPASLEEYSKSFLDHLHRFCYTHISTQRQDVELEEYTVALLGKVRRSGIRYINQLANKLKLSGEYVNSNEQMADLWIKYARYVERDITHAIQEISKMSFEISDAVPELKKGSYLSADKFELDISRKVEKIFDKCFELVFEGNVLSKKAVDLLRRLPALAVSRGVVCGTSSGIIFAGYGHDEIFPSLIWYELNGYISHKLIYAKGGEVKINFDRGAAFRSFGNTESVNTFMNGISSDFREDFGASVEDFYRETQVDGNGGFDINFVRKNFDEIANNMERKFRKKIMSTVALLPKQALAEIASNLIMLSSIKSHISEVDGSVGGPVSSVVISRGDGMIWINRQHYFDSENNPHYMSRYGNRPPRLAADSDK